MQCFRCGQVGHRKRDCFGSGAPTSAIEQHGSTDHSYDRSFNRPRVNSCFRCGRPGHVQFSCTATSHIDGSVLPIASAEQHSTHSDLQSHRSRHESRQSFGHTHAPGPSSVPAMEPLAHIVMNPSQVYMSSTESAPHSSRSHQAPPLHHQPHSTRARLSTVAPESRLHQYHMNSAVRSSTAAGQPANAHPPDTAPHFSQLSFRRDSPAYQHDRASQSHQQGLQTCGRCALPGHSTENCSFPSAPFVDRHHNNFDPSRNFAAPIHSADPSLTEAEYPGSFGSSSSTRMSSHPYQLSGYHNQSLPNYQQPHQPVYQHPYAAAHYPQTSIHHTSSPSGMVHQQQLQTPLQQTDRSAHDRLIAARSAGCPWAASSSAPPASQREQMWHYFCSRCGRCGHQASACGMHNVHESALPPPVPPLEEQHHRHHHHHHHEHRRTHSRLLELLHLRRRNSNAGSASEHHQHQRHHRHHQEFHRHHRHSAHGDAESFQNSRWDDAPVPLEPDYDNLDVISGSTELDDAQLRASFSNLARWQTIHTFMLDQLAHSGPSTHTHAHRGGAHNHPAGVSAHVQLPEFEFDSESDISETICVICQCDFDVGDVIQTTPCVHNFHKDCVSQWFKEKNFCPLCKEVIEA